MALEQCGECTINQVTSELGLKMAKLTLREYMQPNFDKDETLVHLMDRLSDGEVEAIAGCLTMKRLGLCELVLSEGSA